MAFISTVPEEKADGPVREMYESEKSLRGYLPNFAKLFCHRPKVMESWRILSKSINSQMDPRRFELVTLAAARALRSSYCMLAHGAILRQRFYDAEQVVEIAKYPEASALKPEEIAMMQYAERVVIDAASIQQRDIDGLRSHGFSDEEIFEITTTATARCFFSKTLDALGAEPDQQYLDMDEGLRIALQAGRPLNRVGS